MSTKRNTLRLRVIEEQMRRVRYYRRNLKEARSAIQFEELRASEALEAIKSAKRRLYELGYGESV